MIFIDQNACDGCGICVEACPVGCLKVEDNVAKWTNDFCLKCRTCEVFCDKKAIVVEI